MSKSGEEKRLGMSQVQDYNSDFSVVTSDNPKLNDAEQILKEISEAVESNNGRYTAIMDREEAINYAVNIAEKDDVILIAGKGHETTQIIGTEEIPFNEKEIALKAINKKLEVKN